METQFAIGIDLGSYDIINEILEESPQGQGHQAHCEECLGIETWPQGASAASILSDTGSNAKAPLSQRAHYQSWGGRGRLVSGEAQDPVGQVSVAPQPACPWSGQHGG